MSYDGECVEVRGRRLSGTVALDDKVEYDVAALGPQGDAHQIGEDVDAACDTLARVTREFEVLG